MSRSLKPARRSKLAGMTLIRGGEFLMGAADHYPEEAPVRSATVGDFWIDERPVTNREFASFVAATGYRTFAETAPDPRDYPGMPPEMARRSSHRPMRRRERTTHRAGGALCSAPTGAIRWGRGAAPTTSRTIRSSR